ncbi:hypothetical protein SAMN05216505_1011003 [Streptomyces prasinopilosus]|uniref:Transposase of IS4/5 family n=1 Tax=Streptomyces prasinopilosus TaxID=67344 RepID=A0A1G6K8D8_9ACTN|nr:hypothetical protein SAMN05216505_1011003 [Streptomyces prasinopilosus]
MAGIGDRLVPDEPWELFQRVVPIDSVTTRAPKKGT